MDRTASASSATITSSPSIRWLGPALIAIAAIAIAAWSWGTWPDPLVDFGTHCYVPWRLSAGQVLYRDIAYYNGPISPYLNALLFRIFGVGIHTLEVANGLVLVAALVLVYRLLRQASGPIAATMGGLTFVLIFAFGQGLGIGNYNWITPYAHEFTHGLTLGLATLACLHRYTRTQRPQWLIPAGAAAGLAFLTKAEPSATALAGGIALLAAALWAARTPLRRSATAVAIFLATTAAMPIAAALLLMTVLPARLAWLGAAGSWAWVFDRRITSLPFYQHLIGLDDVSGNLQTMLLWTIAYALVLIIATGLAWTVRRGKRTAAWCVVAVLAIAMAARFYHIEWTNMLRPLPVVLLVLLVIAVTNLFRRRGGDRAPLRFALLVFSLALLPKMLLRTQVFHYGFVLALPGTLALTAVMFQELPALARKRWGGDAAPIVRAVMAITWLAAVSATLVTDSRYFATKPWKIEAGTADSFRVDTRGVQVEQMAQLARQALRPDQTLAVFPQGLMVNYLSRRTNPTRYVNFMPPEILAAGEPTILAALKAHPPDVVVLDMSTLTTDGTAFSLDNSYDYGQATLSWINANYQEIATSQPPLALRPMFSLRMKSMQRPTSNIEHPTSNKKPISSFNVGR